MDDDTTLGDRISDLACTALAVQQILELEHRVQLEGVLRQLPPDVLAPGSPFAEVALPPLMALDSLKVEASFWISRRKSAEAEVGLSLSGRSVHAFATLRSETRQAGNCRLVLEVQRSPPPLDIRRRTGVRTP